MNNLHFGKSLNIKMMARKFGEEDEQGIYLHDELEQVDDEFSDDPSSGSEELQIFQ